MKEVAYAFDPVLWCENALGFIPDQWQKDVLRSASKHTLLCCSRQSGKSTIVSALALWTSIYQPKSLILCLSPTLRQSSELFRNVIRFYNQLDEIVPSEAESSLRLELTNGSRIVALPGKEQNIRGMANVSLMIADEAARIEDDLYYSVRPMLAVSNGRLIALSTPFGRRGWFFKEWIQGHGWKRHQIKADQCPRISEEFLEDERRSMPANWYAAEYCCEFIEAVDSVFTYEQVQQSISDEVEPLEFSL
jgi:hypothetical protein